MNDEHRMQSIEDRVHALSIANAGLESSVTHLTAAVSSLTSTVQALRDTMNQGRGALWLAMSAAGGIGALSVVLLKKLFTP